MQHQILPRRNDCLPQPSTQNMHRVNSFPAWIKLGGVFGKLPKLQLVFLEFWLDGGCCVLQAIQKPRVELLQNSPSFNSISNKPIVLKFLNLLKDFLLRTSIQHFYPQLGWQASIRNNAIFHPHGSCKIDTFIASCISVCSCSEMLLRLCQGIQTCQRQGCFSNLAGAWELRTSFAENGADASSLPLLIH